MPSEANRSAVPKFGVEPVDPETEGVGFEPTVPFGTPVFKTGAFNRSATPPSDTIVAADGV